MRMLLRLPVFAFLALACIPILADEGPSGAEIYEQQCARCHGTSGEGTEAYYPDPLVGDNSIEQLAAMIEKTMPEDKDEKCSGDDARKVAAYIHETFYSQDAQLRNKPARIELSRLTVRQYQNAVTDLLGSFRSKSEWGDERGLRGEYYANRRFRHENRKLERTDAEVNFNFGEGSPDPEKFEPHEFSIQWEGSVLAPDTGEYEFVVRTEHAARLWVNDQKQPLIDAWVKSGDDTEYRATIKLIGGRIYPLKLDFSKAKQGVDDKKKNDKAPKNASIVLAWKRPNHEVEVVPSRFLGTKRGSEVFVLQTPFPPDDRSVGYERGTSISKAWDAATTDAALETAGYVATHLGDLANASADKADQEPKLREFCQRFLERAFRRPLTDEQKQVYVDHQFAEASDRVLAVKRVVLLALKSPRFLYREATDQGDGYDVASRLSFTLWDSLPDEQLLKAAAEGQLANRDEVRREAERMVADLRSKSKVRQFLLQWLKVDQPPDLSKDPEKFPEFTAEVISDLRTSLELSLDDVLSGDAADFRQFLLSDSLYLNGRLAKVYGYEMPEDAPFSKVQFQPEKRSGLLSHPYLLAGFAYTAASSPIHRGVFVSRSLLGRALKPPPEAVAPLAPDLHAGLQTRERVALQTKGEACQTCHTMINPLGFTLEHFDALGRYREMEKDRPIVAAGEYLTRSGEVAKFNGVRELATFLSGSEETHTAFVQQLFHYLVKQSIRAYGEQQLPGLRQSFVENQFNIRKLMVEIAASSALPAR